MGLGSLLRGSRKVLENLDQCEEHGMAWMAFSFGDHDRWIVAG